MSDMAGRDDGQELMPATGKLEDGIRAELAKLSRSHRSMIESAWQAGILLVQLRGALAHGEWEPALGRVGITSQRASEYLRLAEGYSGPDAVEAQGGIVKALRALPKPAKRNNRNKSPTSGISEKPAQEQQVAENPETIAPETTPESPPEAAAEAALEAEAERALREDAERRALEAETARADAERRAEAQIAAAKAANLDPAQARKFADVAGVRIDQAVNARKSAEAQVARERLESNDLRSEVRSLRNKLRRVRRELEKMTDDWRVEALLAKEWGERRGDQ